MSLLPHVGGFETGVAGYTVTAAGDFTGASNDYFTRSATAGTSTTLLTFSTFFKRASAGSLGTIMAADTNSADVIRFNTSNQLECFITGATSTWRTTNSFSDTASWHHLLCQIDLTQGTAANKVKWWVDGTSEANTATATKTSFTKFNNNGKLQRIGMQGTQTGRSYDGLLAETYMIDGQIKAVADFATSNSPIAYAGTYGNNGFLMQYDTLGTDTSGNGNNMTSSGVSKETVDLPT